MGHDSSHQVRCIVRRPRQPNWKSWLRDWLNSSMAEATMQLVLSALVVLSSPPIVGMCNDRCLVKTAFVAGPERTSI
jgi:hypothetical protein